MCVGRVDKQAAAKAAAAVGPNELLKGTDPHILACKAVVGIDKCETCLDAQKCATAADSHPEARRPCNIE